MKKLARRTVKKQKDIVMPFSTEKADLDAERAEVVDFWQKKEDTPDKLIDKFKRLKEAGLEEKEENISALKFLRQSYFDMIADLEKSAKRDPKVSIDAIAKLNKSLVDINEEIRMLEDFAQRADVIIEFMKKGMKGCFEEFISGFFRVAEESKVRMDSKAHEKLLLSISAISKEVAVSNSNTMQAMEKQIRKAFEKL